MIDKVTCTTGVLEKITFMAEHRLSANLAEDFAINPQVRIFFDAWLDGFAITVRQSILSQQLDEVRVSYPADWWQAVKKRFAPRWFLRRWPVEYNKTVVDVRAVYPKMALPGEVHFPLVRITGNGDAIVDGLEEYIT